MFALAFQPPRTVNQLGFSGGSYFSFANVVCLEWLHRSSPLLYAANLTLVGFGNQGKWNLWSLVGAIQYNLEEMCNLANKLKQLN